uniref:Uncharacterized protein n=1 Tax=Pseudictyota dubia TaxID=2749911 RepID=A0A7R9Z7Y9_9STRA|mmetsp:Transcript_26741/g.49627  ORF Transcript_26741/g.49627 Transcript_26741/m.49627 type:complete len:207 (+) Transcript_26741:26-646(+)
MELVAKEKEPITPFIHKIRSLYEDYGVSSVLVIGGSGDYFDVADTVVMLDCYKCLDVTGRAKEIAASAASANGSAQHEASSRLPFGKIAPRCPIGSAYKPNDKVNVRAKTVISYGDVELDLAGLEQIASLSQTNALSLSLQRVATIGTGSAMLTDVLASMNSTLDKDGLDSLSPGQFHGGLARPRLYEIAGAVNRLRRDGNMCQKR